MKYSKRVWLAISGVTWMAIGIMLLVKGLRFVVVTTETEAKAPLLNWAVSLASSKQQAGLLLICAALLIGFIKGRTVLAKTVSRIAGRIQAGPASLSMNEVYDRKYYLILCLMIGIGLAFRFLPLPLDIRGVIDVIIGSALINGAMLYFRAMITYGIGSRG